MGTRRFGLTCFALGCGGAVLAGCEDESPAIGLEGGDRLTPLLWDAGDGAAVFRGWHDDDLDVDCVFQHATDGRYRCLPALEGTEHFADSGCTQPVAHVYPCGPAAQGYVSFPVPTTCGNARLARSIHRLGAKRAAGETTWVRQSDGTCLPHEPQSDSDPDFYDLEGEVPPSDFVAADLVPRPAAAPGLSIYTMVAEDGATEATAMWDDGRGAECGADADSGELRCAPVEVADWTYVTYADASCSVPVAAHVARRPCAHASAGRDSTLTLAEVASEVAATDAYLNDGNGCRLVDAQGADFPVGVDNFYILGDPVDPSSFPQLADTLDGSGRVRARRITAADGSELAIATELFDTELDMVCYPRKFDNGTFCVAERVAESRDFTDPACTDPVVLVSGGEAYALEARDAGPSCDQPGTATAFAIGPRVSVPQRYVLTYAGVCTAADPPIDTSFHALGPKIELPELTR